MSEPVDAQPVEPRGLSQADLLDMFDRTEAYPTIRAAIHVVLTGDAARAGDGLLREALMQALDRFDTIGDHLKPDATDDDKHAVAQAWWFGSEEIRAALHATATEEQGQRD